MESKGLKGKIELYALRDPIFEPRARGGFALTCTGRTTSNPPLSERRCRDGRRDARKRNDECDSEAGKQKEWRRRGKKRITKKAKEGKRRKAASVYVTKAVAALDIVRCWMLRTCCIRVRCVPVCGLRLPDPRSTLACLISLPAPRDFVNRSDSHRRSYEIDAPLNALEEEKRITMKERKVTLDIEKIFHVAMRIVKKALTFL